MSERTEDVDSLSCFSGRRGSRLIPRESIDLLQRSSHVDFAFSSIFSGQVCGPHEALIIFVLLNYDL